MGTGLKVLKYPTVQDINNKVNGFNAIDINLEEFGYFGIDVEVFQYELCKNNLN